MARKDEPKKATAGAVPAFRSGRNGTDARAARRRDS